MTLARALVRVVLGFARSSPLGAFALVVLVVLLVVAIFADQIAPYDPLKAFLGQLKKPPSSQHWLGTDFVGRDVLSRIVVGTRMTLVVAIVSIGTGSGVGFVWGLVSGYLGGAFDLLTQRFLDVLMAFPTVILALLLLTAIGAGLWTVIIAIAVVSIPEAARVVRAVALTTKEMDHVTAARAIGARPVRIMLLHVAPQCVAPLMVVASVGLGVAVFAEAALSFLGMGIPPPTPTWGNMLGGILSFIFKPPWWLVVFPGVAIILTVLAFNLLGDALRDYLDPKLRGRLQ